MLESITILLFLLYMYEFNRYTISSKIAIRLTILSIVICLLLYEIDYSFGNALGLSLLVITLAIILIFKK